MLSDQWTWRVDTGPSHLVNLHVDPERSYCGVRAPFTTRGGPDFDPCGRCLRAWRAWRRSTGKTGQPASDAAGSEPVGRPPPASLPLPKPS